MNDGDLEERTVEQAHTTQGRRQEEPEPSAEEARQGARRRSGTPLPQPRRQHGGGEESRERQGGEENHHEEGDCEEGNQCRRQIPYKEAVSRQIVVASQQQANVEEVACHEGSEEVDGQEIDDQEVHGQELRGQEGFEEAFDRQQADQVERRWVTGARETACKNRGEPQARSNRYTLRRSPRWCRARLDPIGQGLTHRVTAAARAAQCACDTAHASDFAA